MIVAFIDYKSSFYVLDLRFLSYLPYVKLQAFGK